MNKQTLPSETSILKWAGQQAFSGRIFDTIRIVNKDNLYYYFSQDGKDYVLVMTSAYNLAEVM